MRVRRCGPRAVLVEFADAAAARAFSAAAFDASAAGDLPSGVEVVPADRTVLIDGADDPLALVEVIAAASGRRRRSAATRHHTIPTVYDGIDLADVAARWDVSVDEAIELHTACDFEVAFIGFAPGFAYLSGLPEALAVPRLDDPRPTVPAGAVAVGGPYSAVYPRSSPGGWRLIGTARIELWSTSRHEPALLRPGDRVRFEPR